jgi:hypothetical protein
MKDFPCNINIHFENGLVKSISFGGMLYTIDDFINLLGEPDEISISVQLAEVNFIHYAIYFSTRKVLITVSPGNRNGPDPKDAIFGLELNAEFDNSTLPTGWGSIRPWLGYGHIKDYLPGGIEYPPTGTPPTP